MRSATRSAAAAAVATNTVKAATRKRSVAMLTGERGELGQLGTFAGEAGPRFARFLRRAELLQEQRVNDALAEALRRRARFRRLAERLCRQGFELRLAHGTLRRHDGPAVARRGAELHRRRRGT